MIQVSVRSILTIKEVLGKGDIQLRAPEGSTVSDLLASMAERWGEEFSSLVFDPSGHLFPHIRVMVNGRDLAFLEKKAETVLREGDEILILSPAGGG